MPTSALQHPDKPIVGYDVSNGSDEVARMGFIDPTPLLDERYRTELARQKVRFGQVKTRRQKWAFRRARRRLRREIYGKLRRLPW